MYDTYARAISSVGRASRLHREGRQFEPVIAHQYLLKIKVSNMLKAKNANFLVAAFIALAVGFFSSSCVFAVPPKKTEISKSAQQPDAKKFADWSLNCQKVEGEKNFCLLTQQVLSTKEDKTQETLALYQVAYFAKEDAVKIIQTFLPDINIDSGTSLVVDNKLIAKGKYVLCTAGTCQSVATISKDELQAILTSKEIAVAMINGQGKQLRYPLSPKGLKEGLAHLKTKSASANAR